MISRNGYVSVKDKSKPDGLVFWAPVQSWRGVFTNDRLAPVKLKEKK